MLVVACYLWHDPTRRSGGHPYTPKDVRFLKDQVAKYLTQIPYEFACITDRPYMFDNDDDIRAIRLDECTHVAGTMFNKLFTFHPDGRNLIGEMVFVLDLDTLIVGNLESLLCRTSDVVLWRNPTRIPWDDPAVKGRPYYNTSFVLHRCGTLPGIYTSFNPNKPDCRDDQWWVSGCLGPDMPYWDDSDGIYRIARADTPGSGVWGDLPDNARIVTACGSEGKFWQPEIKQANPWIKDYISEA